jgi:protein CMS1
MSIEYDLQDPLLGRSSATPEADSPTIPKSSSKKRKRGTGLVQGSKTAAKKPKSKKRKAVDADELDLESGINKAFSHMDNQLLADYMGQRTRKFESDLSSVELEDKYIPGRFCYLAPKESASF